MGNDVGIFLSNLDVACNPVSSPTNNTAQGNSLVNNAVNNTTGNGTGPYQAGISDQGDRDVIKDNYICGLGYPGTDTGGLFAIDVTATNNPTVKDNTICGSSTVAMARLLTTSRRGATKASPVQ